MGKSRNKGRYITKVGYLDIRAKDSFKPVPRGTKLPKNWSPDVASIDYMIYHGKKLVKAGFKTKDEAVKAATELLGDKKVSYSL